MRVIVFTLCLVFTTAARLRAPAKDEKKVAVAVKLHNATNVAAKEVAHKNTTSNATKNATKAPPRNLTADEQVANLNKGLETIMKLKAVFTADSGVLGEDPAHRDLEKFAQGAMSSELSSKDSPVWGAIENMLTATAKSTAEMKGKNTAEQEKIMESLEKTMNEKAATLQNVTEKAGVVQEKHSEEYLLGVLMQHTKDWSMEKQLNTTKTFVNTCDAARELLKSYNKSQPLAPQLAALMDHKKVPAAAKVAAEKSAAKMFIQLVTSLHRA
jgi:hypothetical protein